MKGYLSRPEVGTAIVAAAIVLVVSVWQIATTDSVLTLDYSQLPSSQGWTYKPSFPREQSERIAEIEKHLATGADINAPLAGQDWTLLVTAADRDASEVVAFLLERGADPNVTTDGDVTVSSPLSKAMWRQDATIIEMLLKHGAKTDFTYGRKGEWNDTALLDAIESNHPELVELLLKYEADVNLSPPNVGFTPLVAAVYYEWVSEQIVELLLDNGADPNKAGRSAPSMFPLRSAVGKRDLSTIKLLIKHGADVNQSFAIHVAVQSATDDVVSYLAQVRGADINHNPGFQGNAPLHLAAMKGRLKAAKVLMQHGADPSLKNEDGQTPLDIARQQGRAELVKLLQGASSES